MEEHETQQENEIETEQEAEETSGKTPSMPTIPQLAVALGILLLVFGSSYIPMLKDHRQQATPPQQPNTSEKSSPTEKTDPYDGIQLDAEAAYVWDVAKQKALFNKNASAQLPLASLTKLMTALVATELMDDTASVQITLDAIKQEGESGFYDGDMWNFNNLLNYTLVTSSNDGAYALAAAAGSILPHEGNETSTDVFIKAMNKKAEELGLAQTYYTNPTGLDTSDAHSGSYGSARDMTFLMEYIITKHPEILEKTSESTITTTDQDGAKFVATNTNHTVDEVPGLLGSKTGYTVLAGGNLVIAFDAGLNRPIIISVLGSTPEGRFNDVLSLVQHTQRAVLSQ